MVLICALTIKVHIAVSLQNMLIKKWKPGRTCFELLSTYSALKCVALNITVSSETNRSSTWTSVADTTRSRDLFPRAVLICNVITKYVAKIYRQHTYISLLHVYRLIETPNWIKSTQPSQYNKNQNHTWNFRKSDIFWNSLVGTGFGYNIHRTDTIPM